MTGAQEQPRAPSPTKDRPQEFAHEPQVKTADLTLEPSAALEKIAQEVKTADLTLEPSAVLEKIAQEVKTAGLTPEPGLEEVAQEVSNTVVAAALEEPAGDEEPKAVEAAPSQFVTRLRGEVALSRNSPDCLDPTPSVIASTTPQGTPDTANAEAAASSSAAEAVTSASGGSSTGPTELRVKGSGLKPFKLEGLPGGITVRDLKALSQRFCGMAPDEQKLLHKGKILNDDQTLEELKIATGAQLFLVRGAPPVEAASSSSQADASAATREEEANDFLDPWDDRPAFEDMDDEQLLQALMMGRLCRECGVNPGRLQTDGLCSVCFREMMMREHWLLKERKRQEDLKKQQEEAALKQEEEKRQREEFDMRQKDKTRCKMCNKKHGLTGFMCRCGFYFCSTHRYAEDHGCNFDHQAHGREILAQQNPGVSKTQLNE
jgi:hypothetical protein